MMNMPCKNCLVIQQALNGLIPQTDLGPTTPHEHNRHTQPVPRRSQRGFPGFQRAGFTGIIVTTIGEEPMKTLNYLDHSDDYMQLGRKHI